LRKIDRCGSINGRGRYSGRKPVPSPKGMGLWLGRRSRRGSDLADALFGKIASRRPP
jgi:hypothetical protein